MTMAVLSDSSFLDKVWTTSILNPLVLDIKCRLHNDYDKFKFWGDFLYFEEHLYILEGSLRL